MTLVPRDVIDRVKDETFISLVEETVGGLKKYPHGNTSVKVLCPFHDETDPSLHIYHNHAHCYGCGKSWDAIGWYEQVHNVGFRDALRALAARANIPLPEMDKGQWIKFQAQREYEDALGVAAVHFAKKLQESAKGLEYAHGRAWDDETIKAELIGYADGSPLPDLGNDKAKKAVGAINRWAGKVGGAIIYAHRSGGRVVYLAGRSITGKKHYNLPSDLGGEKRPYLNSLYTSRADRVVLVEGQADAVTLAGWGVPAIAMAGSTVTGDTLELLVRLAKREVDILIVPDGDKKTKVDEIAEKVTPLIRVVELPEDIHDVNDWAKRSGTSEELSALLEEAPEWLETEIERVGKLGKRGRKADMRRVFACIAKLDAYDQARYKDTVMGALHLTARTYNGLLKAYAGGDDHQKAQEQQQDDRYAIENGRICEVGYSGGERVIKPLCDFTAEMVEVVTYDDGSGETDSRIVIEGALPNGERLPRVAIDSREYKSLNWVYSLWAARASIRPVFGAENKLRDAIINLSTQTSYRYIYTHTGWHEVGGQRVYLNGSGGVGANDDNITTDLEGFLAHYQLPNNPDGVASAMEASLRFLDVAPLEITAPLWGAMFLAPVAEIIYPDFVLWLYGESGTLKSTLSALALSHYGEFDRKSLLSWSSTPNALERACFLAKDAPVVIDDFAPQSDPFKARELERNAARIVRNVGNKTGRSRLKRNLRMAKTYTPRGFVISTGEQVPDGQSIQARIFTVELQPGSVHLGRLTKAQEEAHLYPTALAGYLLWAREDWDDLSKKLPDQVNEVKALARETLRGQHLRLPEALSMLYVGCDLGIAYAEATGVISEEEAAELRKRVWDALLSGSKAQARRVEQERPEQRYVAALSELLAQGKIYFDSTNGKTPLGENTVPGERLGWYDDEYIYVLPDAAYGAISKHLGKNGLGVKEGTLRKYLEDAGILEREEANRRTLQLRIDNKRHRVLRLVRSKVLSEA